MPSSGMNQKCSFVVYQNRSINNSGGRGGVGVGVGWGWGGVGVEGRVGVSG